MTIPNNAGQESSVSRFFNFGFLKEPLIKKEKKPTSLIANALTKNEGKPASSSINTLGKILTSYETSLGINNNTGEGEKNTNKNERSISAGQWNPKNPPTLTLNSVAAPTEPKGQAVTLEEQNQKQTEKKQQEEKKDEKINSGKAQAQEGKNTQTKAQEAGTQEVKTHEENRKELKERSDTIEKEKEANKVANKEATSQAKPNKGNDYDANIKDKEEELKKAKEERYKVRNFAGHTKWVSSIYDKADKKVKKLEKEVAGLREQQEKERKSREQEQPKVDLNVNTNAKNVTETTTENSKSVKMTDPEGDGKYKATSEVKTDGGSVKTTSDVENFKVAIVDETKQKDGSTTRTEAAKAKPGGNVNADVKVDKELEKDGKVVVENIVREKVKANEYNMEERIEKNGDIEINTRGTTTNPETGRTEQTEMNTKQDNNGTITEIKEGKRDTNKGNLEYGVETNGGKTTVTTKNGDVYTEATLTEDERGKVEQFIERVQGGKKLNGEGDVKVVKNKDGNILVVTNEGKVIPIDTRLEQAAEYLDWGGGKVKDGASNAWNWVKSWF